MEQTATGLQKRRFHRELRNLKKFSKENDLTLKSFDDASPYDQCVISENEFEIGELARECDPDLESYFYSPIDYERYWLLTI